LLTTGLTLIGLLILNFFFVRTFFSSNSMNIDMGVFNAIQFVLPILLVFIEFWIYDAMVDFFRYRNIESLNEPELSDEQTDD